MKIAYILPTRNRPLILLHTLAALGSLPRHNAQVVVIDNASAPPPAIPTRLSNGILVEVIRLRTNAGAAARNAGVMVSDPGCEWVVMLDDDSTPVGLGHLDALASARNSVAVVAAEIWLSDADGTRLQRESGGLPEVFIGCGVAIRREAFLEARGYDHTFGYYAEEYDLAAKLLRSGMRIAMDRRFQVAHRKVTCGRDMNLIVERLVRNNGWVTQRYAPGRRRLGELRHVLERYGAITARQHAQQGYRSGLNGLLQTIRGQPRTPLSGKLWARFTGAAAARASLERAWIKRGFRTAAIIDEGKNARVIRAALRDLGVREIGDQRAAEALVIGTLSPGPMLDAWDTRRADPRCICPWDEIVDDPQRMPSVAA